MRVFLTFFAALQLFLQVNAEVTVLQVNQVIYDKSPKLRIRGTGFDAEDHDIQLELGMTGAEPLRIDKDYLVTKDQDNDGIILKLLGNRRWGDLEDRTPPVALILSSVKFNGGPNLLAQQTIVAQVLATPSVEEDTDKIIYQTASNELRINGTGFIGAKKVDLYFDPPLVKEVSYEDVTRYPLRSNQIVLRLRHDYKWRDEPGPLNVLGVDTGGGPVKLRGDEGFRIADVQENLDLHGVSVSGSTKRIYADEADLVIHGSGFNEVGNLLRFTNGILGNNVNYTVVSTTTDEIKLRLVPGSFWRKNFENLPGALTLLAVNAGEGYIAVGPVNSGKGKDVAMVFERPVIHSAQKKLYRTHSHELKVTGTGFPTDVADIALRFNPPLEAGVDYSVVVNDRTELVLTLLDGRSWRSDAGPLQITAVNSRGDEAGWVTMPGDGVHIAEIQEDIDSDVTGGVEVFPMGVKVYQSLLRKDIEIVGTGFTDDIEFTFEPSIKKGIDYELVPESKNKILLKLRPGKRWAPTATSLIAKSVKINRKEFALAGTEGIRVAVILEDPVIAPSKELFHESQSKLIVVEGSGFTSLADTKITLRPTPSSSYKVLGVLDDAIRIQLMPDNDWLPSFMSLQDEDESKKITMQLSAIDTGAGEIVFDDPVTIGFIVKDREGVTCDDSCEFAFDGVCDDGSEPNDQYYYQNYNNYMDDDFGGFYYDDYEGGEEGDNEDDGDYGDIFYDDYYMENEDYQVSPCVEGTDCTDCGGVDAIIDYSRPLSPDSGVTICDNTCIYPRDGVCDDVRGTKYCELGTDCQDCGPVGADNFTEVENDWWDDDDDYWSFNDGNFIDQTKGLEANRHKVKVYHRDDSAGPAAMFLVVLEGMVYTVGAIFAATALYLLNKWYKGEPLPFMNAFNAEIQSTREFELAPTKKMPITPDVYRS